MVTLLYHVVEKVREQQVFSREDVPTEERVWAAFVCHSGSSFRAVGEVLGHSRETVHQWYSQISELFEPISDSHRVTVVDETKVAVEDQVIYVWASVDVASFEVVHI